MPVVFIVHDARTGNCDERQAFPDQFQQPALCFRGRDILPYLFFEVAAESTGPHPLQAPADFPFAVGTENPILFPLSFQLVPVHCLFQIAVQTTFGHFKIGRIRNVLHPVVTDEPSDEFQHNPFQCPVQLFRKVHRQPEQGIVRPGMVPVDAEPELPLPYLQIDMVGQGSIQHLVQPADLFPRGSFRRRSVWQLHFQELHIVQCRTVEIVKALFRGQVHSSAVGFRIQVRSDGLQGPVQKTVRLPAGGSFLRPDCLMPRLMSAFPSSDRIREARFCMACAVSGVHGRLFLDGFVFMAYPFTPMVVLNS